MSTIKPGSADVYCGRSVSAGDIDLDGYDDVAFGCSGAGSDGLVGLQMGGASVSDDIALPLVTTKIEGTASTGAESLGSSVLIADISGDGQPDLLGGAEDYSSGISDYQVGRVFFVDGTSVASGVFDIANADGLVVGETAGFSAGAALASVPDLDGDGSDELLVLGNGYNTTGAEGGAFLFTGGEW